MYRGLTVAVVIPALNEAQSIGRVVTELVALNEQAQPTVDQIVVCDNGSTDETAIVAARAGAQVVAEVRKGYGRACLRGVSAVRQADVLVFVDGDYSAVTGELHHLLDVILQGADLAIGARDNAGCQCGAMSRHQVWGNRLTTALMRLCWATTATDLGPFRAIRRSVFEELGLCEPTFGWTMEMQARAIARGYAVEEVPVRTRRRIGQSKVSGTWRGSVGAAHGILTTLARIYWQERQQRVSQARKTLPVLPLQRRIKLFPGEPT